MTTDFESITHQWKIYDLKLDQLVSIHMALTIMAGGMGIAGRFIRISILYILIYLQRIEQSPKKDVDGGMD